MKMSTKNRLAIAVALALAAILTSAAAAPPATAPSEATDVAGAFPDGLPKGAVAVDNDTVSFDGGNVILELAGTLSYSDCPSGWLCLWEDRDYSGRMLKFQSTMYWQNLTDYGFNDEMSSWRNRRGYDSKWAWHTNGGGTRRCMDSYSSSNYVGSGDNDEASSIVNYVSDSYC